MRPPCLDLPGGKRHHNHRLTVDGKFATQGLCLSAFLWGQVARAVCLEQRVRMDGRDVRWDKLDAYAFLKKMAPIWRRNIDAPQVHERGGSPADGPS